MWEGNWRDKITAPLNLMQGHWADDTMVWAHKLKHKWAAVEI